MKSSSRIAVFACSLLLLLPGSSRGEWGPWGRGISNPSGPVAVCTATEYQGRLIIGGYLTRADSTTAVNYIAAWDGFSWQALGAGMGSGPNVLSLVSFRGDLIAGGDFTIANGAPADFVARWDGSAWHALGAGTNAGVRAMVVYNDELIAVGDFTWAGNGGANHVAAWDGTSWRALGAGLDDVGLSAAVYDGALFVGGSYGNAGGVAAANIARWNGGEWTAVGSGTDGTVGALAVHRGELVAGGTFSTAGSGAAHNLASWNGSDWAPLGSGTDASIANLGLWVYNGDLIAAGIFTTAGGVPASRIARWDGASWSALGSGVTGDMVRALTSYQGALIVGGRFQHAGGIPSSNLARWSDGLGACCLPCEVCVLLSPDQCGRMCGAFEGLGSGCDPLPCTVSAIGDPARDALQRSASATPNPTGSGATIRFTRSYGLSVTIEIVDVAGRLIRRIDAGPGPAGDDSVIWDGRDGLGRAVAAGVYVASIRSLAGVTTARVVVVR